MKIFSISVIEGEYQGKAFSNLYIYCEDENINKYVNKALRSFKIRKRDMDQVLDDYHIKDYSDLIGKNIHKLYYDRYGNVNDIRFD